MLLQKLEIVIKQFAMDREQNSKKIGDLKTFLDRNIAVMKNNWDDKRGVEVQTMESFLGGGSLKTDRDRVNKNRAPFIWTVVDSYIDASKMRLNLDNEGAIEMARK